MLKLTGVVEDLGSSGRLIGVHFHLVLVPLRLHGAELWQNETVGESFLADTVSKIFCSNMIGSVKSDSNDRLYHIWK